MFIPGCVVTFMGNSIEKTSSKKVHNVVVAGGVVQVRLIQTRTSHGGSRDVAGATLTDERVDRDLLYKGWSQTTKNTRSPTKFKHSIFFWQDWGVIFFCGCLLNVLDRRDFI